MLVSHQIELLGALSVVKTPNMLEAFLAKFGEVLFGFMGHLELLFESPLVVDYYQVFSYFEKFSVNRSLLWQRTISFFIRR